MKNHNKAFTLIELLVVIAIIGILAAIILASLSSARNGAKDAKIKEEMTSLRKQFELDYNATNLYHYNNKGTNFFPGPVGDARTKSGPEGGRIKWTPPSILDTYGDYFWYDHDNTAGNEPYISLAKDIYAQNSDGVIVEVTDTGENSMGASRFALYAKLSNGKYFCIDSSGLSKDNTNYPGDNGLFVSGTIPTLAYCR